MSVPMRADAQLHIHGLRMTAKDHMYAIPIIEFNPLCSNLVMLRCTVLLSQTSIISLYFLAVLQFSFLIVLFLLG